MTRPAAADAYKRKTFSPESREVRMRLNTLAAAFLAAMFLLALAGCGKSKTEADAPPATTPSHTQPTTTVGGEKLATDNDADQKQRAKEKATGNTKTANAKVETLVVSQSGKSYLAISLPHRPATDDKLVLVYVKPDSGERPENLFCFPIRNVDRAVADVRKTANTLGIINVHQISNFANGLFDFVYTENSRGKRGVYVYCDVAGPDNQHERGSCTTYLRLSDWSTDSPEAFEIPLPTPANPSEQKYLLPPVAQLHAWLFNERGGKLAEGKVTVRRDEKPE
jgi:hypothetical protein